ncbi:MAG TPA: hypothetical protein VGO67_14895 [Verrucomicrobiae bacterium]
MKAPQILYNSSDIHGRIKYLLADPNADDRRVVLVAYIGKQAESYLPHPKGLRVICNPSAGGTDPDALRSLIKRGATVEFSDALHMKVYWSRQKGCVITSANASLNALGVSGLKEAGVWMPPSHLDIDRLIKYARPRKITARELMKLDLLARQFARRHGGNYVGKAATREFAEWHESPHRPCWKLDWSDERVIGTAKAVKEVTSTEYGRTVPYTWASVRKGRVQQNDWLLSFRLGKRGVAGVYWKYVDFVVKISPEEKKFYSRKWPCHAVQVHAASKCPTPPFKLSPRFRAALNRAAEHYSRKIKTAKTDVPSASFLSFIDEEMRK